MTVAGGAVADELLAGDLHRSVGLRVDGEVHVVVDRLAQRQRAGAAAGRRLVGVHVDRGDEDPVCAGKGRHCRSRPRRVAATSTTAS